MLYGPNDKPITQTEWLSLRWLIDRWKQEDTQRIADARVRALRQACGVQEFGVGATIRVRLPKRYGGA